MYFNGKMTQVALYAGSLSLRDKAKPLTKENINEFSAELFKLISKPKRKKKLRQYNIEKIARRFSVV